MDSGILQRAVDKIALGRENELTEEEKLAFAQRDPQMPVQMVTQALRKQKDSNNG